MWSWRILEVYFQSLLVSDWKYQNIYRVANLNCSTANLLNSAYFLVSLALICALSKFSIRLYIDFFLIYLTTSSWSSYFCQERSSRQLINLCKANWKLKSAKLACCEYNKRKLLRLGYEFVHQKTHCSYIIFIEGWHYINKNQKISHQLLNAQTKKKVQVS